MAISEAGWWADPQVDRHRVLPLFPPSPACCPCPARLAIAVSPVLACSWPLARFDVQRILSQRNALCLSPDPTEDPVVSGGLSVP